MSKIWQPIKGFENYYLVSIFGSVMSIGKRSGAKDSRTLKPYLSNGYYKVRLSAGGKQKQIAIHKLVAEAFVPKIEGKTQVNHRDGDKLNNKWNNLEWCTNQENVKHAYDNGLGKPIIGEKVNTAKLTEANVRLVRKLFSTGYWSKAELARRFRVSWQNIHCIVTNKSWKYLNSNKD